MRWWTLVILFCVTSPSRPHSVNENGVKDEWLEVNLVQGPVRGRREHNEGLYGFYNIPYATVPTGGDKFKAPSPPPTWKEPYAAVDKGIICPQFDVGPLMPAGLIQKENCLVANVYVPDTKKKNLTVLVYVHGGAFQVAFGNWRQPKKLIKYSDVIAVTFNYRLGIHGFLCLGTEDIPGNAGMKDQVALLRWVQQNIAAFGGNPDDVTIAGNSAGSASVDLLMISNSAEGLFHKVIPESGGNLGAVTIQSDPLQNAKDHAKTLNFTDIDDIYALEEFYKTLPLDIVTSDAFMDRTDSTFLFSPCVERDNGEGSFLTDSPLSILKRGDYKKVPMLYGFTDMEGLLRIDFFEKWKNQMNDKFSDFLPSDLKFETEAERDQVAKQIKEFYFGDKVIDKDSVLRYVDYFSDVIFIYPMLRAVKLHVDAGHDQVYLYEYSFVDEDTPVVPYTNVRGATHIAQTYAVLDGKNLTCSEENQLSEEYVVMKKIMRHIWLSFIKTGKPIHKGNFLPEWPAVGQNRSPHMSLGLKIELREKLVEQRALFWDNIYQKYYRKPISPTQPVFKTYSVHTEL